MRYSLASFRPFINRNLSISAIVVITGAGATSSRAVAQVNDWIADSSVWDNAASWELGLPIQGQVQRIATNAASGNTLFWRSGSSGTVFGGTIDLRSTSNVGTFANGAGTASVIVSFGVNAGLDSEKNLTIRTVGEDMTFIIPGIFHARGRPNKSIDLNPTLLGDGSLVFSQLPGSGPGVTNFTVGARAGPLGEFDTESEFTGGTTINADVSVNIPRDSIQNELTKVVDSGPLGSATLTLNGGTLNLASGVIPAPTGLGNAIVLTADSVVYNFGPKVRSLKGFVNLTSGAGSASTGHTLLVDTLQILRFDDASFSPGDTGTIAFANTGADDSLRFSVASGTSVFNAGSTTFGGAVGIIQSDGSLRGNVSKEGGGFFAAKHFRVNALSVDAGTLAILQDGSTVYGDTGTINTSIANTLAIAGTDTSPEAALDLTNGKLIVDYTGTSPIGGVYNSGSITPSGHAARIKAAWNDGNWNGNGITSSLAAGTTSFGVGYAEASALSLSTFGGVAVDSTSLLMRFTYYADADLSGQVGLPDFTILGNAFGLTNAHWSDGDANYDGVIDLNDFTALATNFGMNQLARGGPPRLQPLYIALLDYPQIYWEARGSRELWAMFEQFESMNLGPIPAMPEGLRSIPEPATGAAVLLAMAATRYRTRRRWA